jgi:hypothetical protein
VNLCFALPISPGEAFGYVTEMKNWPEYWAGFVRFVGPADARWRAPGDRVSVLIRLLGRKRVVHMELREFERDRRVVYVSRQQVLPEARHERYFTPAAGGCQYRVVVECERRRGIKGLIDRWIVKPSIERTIRRTAERIRSAIDAKNNSLRV